MQIWRFDTTAIETKFELLLTSTYNTSCLTQVNYLRLGTESFLLTAGTDGHIAFWPLATFTGEQMVVEHGQTVKLDAEYDFPEMQISWRKRHQIHQSSIKCMAITCLSEKDAMIATGGDDNSIAITLLSHSTTEPRLPVFSTLLIPRAHAATITAIQLKALVDKDTLPTQSRYRLLTSGNDQRLKSWILSVDISEPGVERLLVTKDEDLYTGIADVSCMKVLPGDTSAHSVIVGGIGLETVRIGG